MKHSFGINLWSKARKVPFRIRIRTSRSSNSAFVFLLIYYFEANLRNTWIFVLDSVFREIIKNEQNSKIQIFGLQITNKMVFYDISSF